MESTDQQSTEPTSVHQIHGYYQYLRYFQMVLSCQRTVRGFLGSLVRGGPKKARQQALLEGVNELRSLRGAPRRPLEDIRILEANCMGSDAARAEFAAKLCVSDASSLRFCVKNPTF